MTVIRVVSTELWEPKVKSQFYDHQPSLSWTHIMYTVISDESQVEYRASLAAHLSKDP